MEGSQSFKYEILILIFKFFFPRIRRSKKCNTLRKSEVHIYKVPFVAEDIPVFHENYYLIGVVNYKLIYIKHKLLERFKLSEKLVYE